MAVLTVSRPNHLTAAPFVPQTRSLAQLREAAKNCEGCELFRHATQTVIGEGPKHARIVFVGEQPGDQEDKAGKPFVGPAGRLLDKALLAAGVTREDVYVTNAVKHFKFTLRGKKRLHSKPSAREVTACKPWLVAELLAIKPALVVCLGATAAQAMMGSYFKLLRDRGRVLTAPTGERCLSTYHPSAILRAMAFDGSEKMWDDFVADVKIAAEWVKTSS
ncbi:MAG TPA: UdgX family uracil-DNA binding protein [Planctomycetota bacterium]|nr:UdgX family uracil-DNA binding protein [Planctomycetota bacterium]